MNASDSLDSRTTSRRDDVRCPSLNEWLIRLGSLEVASGSVLDEIRQHEIRVARSAAALAKEIGMGHQGEINAFIAGRFHDIGKLKIRPEVLLKPGALDKNERDIMESHTSLGLETINSLGYGVPEFLSDAILYHHERYDGKGYFKLKGEQIPYMARLISIVDVHDALRAKRVYKAEISEGEALVLMTREHDKFGRSAFDPVLLRKFVAMRLRIDRSIDKECRATLEKFVASNPNDDLAPDEMVGFHADHRKIYRVRNDEYRHIASVMNTGEIKVHVVGTVLHSYGLGWMSNGLNEDGEVENNDWDGIVHKVS